jgi:SAM-dependent methyltransferase
MQFKEYSKYYDLLYSDKDYLAESLYICDILFKYGITNGKILELGSGTGIHGKLISERGYIVQGIEYSSEMIQQSIMSETFSILEGDIRNFELNQLYDSVISLFHVLSYQITNSDIKSVFNCVSNHLKPGGLFIFDFWYTPAVYFHKPIVRLKQKSNDKFGVIRIAEPFIKENENIVEVKFKIFAQDFINGKLEQFEELHSMRHFSLPEIDNFAEQAGMVRIGEEEFLTSNKISCNTWGPCVILKKI